MKVSELVAKLLELPQELEVILQKDAEGNGYSPLSDVDADEIYVCESTYHGDVFQDSWTHEEAGFPSPSEWESFKEDHVRCVVLSPVN